MAQRKLAAIMFSEIVDYNDLLEADQRKAFRVLKTSQLIHKKLIRKYHGRWLKEMGEGILASFSSNMDAVLCALSTQQAAMTSGISIRIGIHQGDVIFEKKDVLGDGVNIAARIQSLADQNEIVISETVFNELSNKDGFEVAFLGEKSLKGVAKPTRIYKVTGSLEKIKGQSIDTGELIRPLNRTRTLILITFLIISFLAVLFYYFIRETGESSKPEKSILVLPFDNYIGTDTLDFLVAGMHDALIGNIGKINALRVKSTTTAKAYKNSEKSIPEIANELGVNVVIEGSVLCIGDSVCLRVQIFDPEEENQIWIQDYYEERSQILNLYNTITREISDEINVNLKPSEESMLTEYRTVNPDAYDAYVKGKLYLDQIDRKSLPLATQYFRRAIEIDPDWAPPYAGLAEAGQYQKQMAFAKQSDVLPKIYENLYKAIELEPDAANTHYTRAIIAVWSEYDWQKGEEEFKNTLELNPSDALCRIFYSHLLMILGRKDEALYQGEQAYKLDPYRSFVLGLYGAVLTWAKEYEKSIAVSNEALLIDSTHYFATRALSGAYAFMGDYENWFEYWQRHFWWDRNELPHIKETLFDQGYQAAVQEIIRVNEEALESGKQIHYHGQARRYLIVNNYNKALDYFELMYETKDPNLPYLATNAINFPELKNYERYIILLNEMNLPLPK